MKKVALFCLILFAYDANAQSLELGIGGGFSTNTSPTGNMRYKSDQALINYAATLKLLYTTPSNWQFGLDNHLLELSGKSSKKFQSFLSGTDSLGGDGKKFVYSKYTTSICGVINKAFASKKNSKNNFYIGLAFGYASARTKTEILKKNEDYKGPDGGNGIVYGAQAGYVASLTDLLSLNLDVAVRSYSLKHSNGSAPLVVPEEKLKYGIVAVPVTVGIRYYFFRVNPRSIPRFNGRPMGRANY